MTVSRRNLLKSFVALGAGGAAARAFGRDGPAAPAPRAGGWKSGTR